MLYLSHTRAGFRSVGRLSGAFLGLVGACVRQSVVLWTLERLRARSARVFRACGRGGVPLPFFARAQSLRVYPLIVYGEYAGEYRVWCKVSASECAYCIIIRA